MACTVEELSVAPGPSLSIARCCSVGVGLKRLNTLLSTAGLPALGGSTPAATASMVGANRTNKTFLIRVTMSPFGCRSWSMRPLPSPPDVFELNAHVGGSGDGDEGKTG